MPPLGRALRCPPQSLEQSDRSNKAITRAKQSPAQTPACQPRNGGNCWNDYGPPATQFPGRIQMYIVEFGTWTSASDSNFTDFYQASATHDITSAPAWQPGGGSAVSDSGVEGVGVDCSVPGAWQPGSAAGVADQPHTINERPRRTCVLRTCAHAMDCPAAMRTSSNAAHTHPPPPHPPDPVCSPACDHGNCTAPDTCACEAGWEGPACSTPGGPLAQPARGRDASFPEG